MTYSKHRVIFNITNERPFDVKDLSFQGFIVTVPDPGDGVEFNTTVPYTNITLPVPAPTSTSSSSGSHSSSLTATITKISSIVGTIIFILIASCCVWGCIRGCCSCSGGSRRPSVRPRTSGGLPLQRRESANNTNFPPPPPPYEPPRTAAPIPDSPYSPYPTPAAPTPQSPPPATPSPAFLPRKDPIVPPSPISPWLAQNSTTPAEKPVRPASSLAGPSGQPSALYASIWGNPTADTKPTLVMPTPPNPVRTARPQSPAWQDSSEALD
ncbi:hypothetical protein FRC17_007335 [Serendipita sp. 399]|nr:hypothetical protein FRC17_007335 [Serendipita sp. 399]